MTAESVRAQITRRFTPTIIDDQPGWIPADTLMSTSDTRHLDAMLAVRRRDRRAHTDTAAGSLLMLEYARLLSWPVLAARLVDGATLDPSPTDVALRPDALEHGGLAFRRGPAPSAPPRGPYIAATGRRHDLHDDVVDGLVEHLDRFGDAIRRRVRVGRRTLHGDIAAALGGGLLALSWMRPPRDRHLPLAVTMIDSRAALRGLTELHSIDHGDDSWMVLWRRACCLAYGVAATRSYCGTCPILDESERVGRFHDTARRYLALTEPAHDGR